MPSPRHRPPRRFGLVHLAALPPKGPRWHPPTVGDDESGEQEQASLANLPDAFDEFRTWRRHMAQPADARLLPSSQHECKRSAIDRQADLTHLIPLPQHAGRSWREIVDALSNLAGDQRPAPVISLCGCRSTRQPAVRSRRRLQPRHRSFEPSESLFELPHPAIPTGEGRFLAHLLELRSNAGSLV